MFVQIYSSWCKDNILRKNLSKWKIFKRLSLMYKKNLPKEKEINYDYKNVRISEFK